MTSVEVGPPAEVGKSVNAAAGILGGIDRYRSVSEIASKLPLGRGGARVQPSTIKRWNKTGVVPAGGSAPIRLPALRVGSRWFVCPAEFERFVLAVSRVA